MRRVPLAARMCIAVVVIVTVRTASACTISDLGPTTALPTMTPPQTFSFVATNDWEGIEAWGALGTSLAVSDVDGGAQLDVVMGAPYVRRYRGAAYVQLGPTTGIIAVDTLPVFYGPERMNAVGSSIVPIPDWSGDGEPELAIGAPMYGRDRGAVYVFDSEQLF